MTIVRVTYLFTMAKDSLYVYVRPARARFITCYTHDKHHDTKAPTFTPSRHVLNSKSAMRSCDDTTYQTIVLII